MEQMGQYGLHPELRAVFYGENNKSISPTLKNILFYQNIICWLSYESFFILCNFFCPKTVISS